MPKVVEDCDGEWLGCVRRDCDLELTRPGKVQCSGDTDKIGCPQTETELIDRLTKHCAHLQKHAEALAAGINESFKLYDEYWPALMARPGSTATKKWLEYNT